MNLKLLIEQVLFEQKLIDLAEQAELVAQELKNLRDFADLANASADEAKQISKETGEELDVSALYALRDHLKSFLFTALGKRFDDKQLDDYIDVILFNPDKAVGPRGERLFNSSENMRGLRYLKTQFIGGL